MEIFVAHYSPQDSFICFVATSQSLSIIFFSGMTVSTCRSLTDVKCFSSTVCLAWLLPAVFENMRKEVHDEVVLLSSPSLTFWLNFNYLTELEFFGYSSRVLTFGELTGK